MPCACGGRLSLTLSGNSLRLSYGMVDSFHVSPSRQPRCTTTQTACQATRNEPGALASGSLVSGEVSKRRGDCAQRPDLDQLHLIAHDLGQFGEIFRISPRQKKGFDPAAMGGERFLTQTA